MFFQSDFLKLLIVASLRVVSGKLFHNLQVVTVKVLPPSFWRLTMGQATLKFAYLVFREWVSLVLAIMPKIPEISVGSQMERSVSVPFDRNIRNHLWRWSTYFGRTGPTEICRSILTNRFIALLLFNYVMKFGKEIKKGKSHSSLFPGLMKKCRSIFLGYSHWFPTGRSGVMNKQLLDEVEHDI